MAQIINVFGKKRLTIGNEEYGRTMSIGADWGKLRLGIRFGVHNDVATANLLNTSFAFGLSEGTDLMYKSVSCRDFIGVHWGQPVGATQWNWSAGSYTIFNGPIAVSRVNGVNTLSASGSTPALHSGDPYGYYTGVFADFQKNGSSGVSVAVRRLTVAPSPITQEVFMRAMEDESGYAGYGVGPDNLTIAGYAGNALWDSVNIAWNLSAPYAMEIAQISVVRYQ